MNKEEFIKELDKLKIEYTNDMLDKLETYYKFLLEYNSHTNLTAIKNKEDIYLKHFYDSLTIVKSYDYNKVNSLLDIGTGAGFPGMVIKIFYPEIEVTLLDSNNKKTKFLEELSDKLKIKVKIINDRVENYSKNNLNSYDIVTSRAVANLRVLSEISLPLVKQNGYFIALKGHVIDELKDAKNTISMMDGVLENIITFDLYKNSGMRNIIIIKKIGLTNINKIRTYDKILKKPLVKKN